LTDFDAAISGGDLHYTVLAVVAGTGVEVEISAPVTGLSVLSAEVSRVGGTLVRPNRPVAWKGEVGDPSSRSPVSATSAKLVLPVTVTSPLRVVDPPSWLTSTELLEVPM
jgi:hypothetical protein